uniref:Neurotransmitter-gated ion-channel ligand-binding domain-containing protein n=2 Tax=Clastoptera arizonana TaxID=38151 RepID=A0A1B6DXZ4_9HEMI
MLSLIWKPHIFLSNERASQQSDELVSILPQGDVLFTSRIKSTIRCTTEDGNFPFDNQNCKLILDSWRYNSKHLTLQWEPTQPVSISSSAGLTEFLLADLQTTTNENFFTNHIRQAQTEPQCSVYTYDEIDDYNTTTELPTVQNETCEVYSYSSLSLAVILSREYGFYVWDYYFPSVLMVIISWGTFWVEPDIVPARIWIATSTMLGFFALGAMNDAVPTLTQLKTHDIWFVGCTLFILISLMEFAFVNIVHRQELKHHQIKRPTSKYILKSSLKSEKVPWKEMVQKSNSCPSSPEIRNRAKRQSVVGRLQLREEKALSILDLATPITDVKTVRRTQIRISETPVEPVHMTNHEMATWIDRRSRVVFPLAFVAFNAFYWSIMLINFK